MNTKIDETVFNTEQKDYINSEITKAIDLLRNELETVKKEFSLRINNIDKSIELLEHGVTESRQANMKFAGNQNNPFNLSGVSSLSMNGNKQFNQSFSMFNRNNTEVLNTFSALSSIIDSMHPNIKTLLANCNIVDSAQNFDNASLQSTISEYLGLINGCTNKLFIYGIINNVSYQKGLKTIDVSKT